MDFMTLVKDRWFIFLAIGLFFVTFLIISELGRRSEKKKALKAQSEAPDKLEIKEK